MVYLHSRDAVLVAKTHIDNFAQIGIYTFKVWVRYISLANIIVNIGDLPCMFMLML